MPISSVISFPENGSSDFSVAFRKPPAPER